MKTACLRCSIVALAVLGVTATSSAQKDRVQLTDGTLIEGAAVTSFDLRNVSYRKGGSTQQASTDRVADLQIDRVRDAYKRAEARRGTDTGPAAFLDEADRLKDPFLSQFGYAEAARILLRRGNFADAFTVLDELQQKFPDSGFLPMTFGAKIEYYLGRGPGAAGDALKVAREYETTTQTKGYPQGFQVEARYYALRAQALGGELDGAKLETAMRALVSQAGSYPQVADRARLAIADARRRSGDFPGATQIYDELLAKDYSSATVRAGAFLGRGQVLMGQGSSADSAPFRAALLSFLRVYVETPDAPPAMVATSLELAASAAGKWGGQDSGFMKSKLEWMLRRDYPDYEPGR